VEASQCYTNLSRKLKFL